MSACIAYLDPRVLTFRKRGLIAGWRFKVQGSDKTTEGSFGFPFSGEVTISKLGSNLLHIVRKETE